MANSKVHALTDGVAPVDTDEFYLSRSPFTTGHDYRIAWSALTDAMQTISDALYVPFTSGTDATINVGDGGVSGDLVIQTDGVTRATFTFDGITQFGTALGITSPTPTNLVYAGQNFTATGASNQQLSHFVAESKVKGTGPTGPSSWARGYTSWMKDMPASGGEIGVVNRTITAATNATPIVCTAASHGFSNGDAIAVYGATGNTAANGQWIVANKTTDTFELAGSVGNGVYNASSGTATNRGSYYGAFFAVAPILARGGLTGTAAHSDDVNGMGVYNAGTAKATSGYLVNHASGFTAGAPEFVEAFKVEANAQKAFATVETGTYDSGIYLPSTFNNAMITLNGTAPYGLDYSSGTFAGAGALFANNVYFMSAKQAGGSAVGIMKLNTSDEIQFAQPARFLSDVTVASAANIVFGTGTGTKIGTGTTQKLAFYNATPVVQPAGNTDVLASLVTLGLRAASSDPPLDIGNGVIGAGSVTFTGAVPINIANGALVKGRNNANNAYLSMFSLNSLDEIQFFQATRFPNATMTIADGGSIALGTTNGTKIGTGATQKIGFYNATPVVQPVAGAGSNFTANAGTAMNSLSTSTGGTGSSAYTFPDIVRVLKNLGLIAA